MSSDKKTLPLLPAAPSFGAADLLLTRRAGQTKDEKLTGAKLLAFVQANVTGGGSGAVLRHGNGAPDDSIGANGDFYIDEDAYDLYGPKQDGEWPTGVSLVGESGLSAYQIALLNGFAGTEEEWLASLEANYDDLPDLSIIFENGLV